MDLTCSLGLFKILFPRFQRVFSIIILQYSENLGIKLPNDFHKPKLDLKSVVNVLFDMVYSCVS